MKPEYHFGNNTSMYHLMIVLSKNNYLTYLLKHLHFCREYGQGSPRLGWHISFIKYDFLQNLFLPYQFCLSTSILFFIFRSLAEFCRIPVVVTNQVRSQFRDEASLYAFQGATLWSIIFYLCLDSFPFSFVEILDKWAEKSEEVMCLYKAVP